MIIPPDFGKCPSGTCAPDFTGRALGITMRDPLEVLIPMKQMPKLSGLWSFVLPACGTTVALEVPADIN